MVNIRIKIKNTGPKGLETIVSKEGAHPSKSKAKAALAATAAGAKYLWDHAPQAWRAIEPAVYAGMMFYMTNKACDQLDPFFDKGMPFIGDTFEMYGTDIGRTLIDNISNIGALVGGGYVAHKVYKMTKKYSEERPRKATGLLKKAKSAFAIALATPLVATFMYLNPPAMVTGLKHRTMETSVSQAMAETKPRTGRSTYLDETREEIFSTGKISKEMLTKDTQLMKKLGYKITDRDLYYLTKVLSAEGGPYFEYDDFIRRQKDDIAGIMNNAIINRMAASTLNPEMKKSFNKGDEVTWENIVMAYNDSVKTRIRRGKKITYPIRTYQFTAAASESNRKKWEDGFQKRDLFYKESKWSWSKIALTYMTILEVLENAAYDPKNHNGSFFYINPRESSQDWSGKKSGGSNGEQFVWEKVDSIQDHDYYGLFDSNGTNHAFEWRDEFYRKLGARRTN